MSYNLVKICYIIIAIYCLLYERSVFELNFFCLCRPGSAQHLARDRAMSLSDLAKLDRLRSEISTLKTENENLKEKLKSATPSKVGQQYMLLLRLNVM